MSNTSSSSGIGFLGLLTILFIGLKLGGIISWSWWLVLFPLYGVLALLVGIGLTAGLCTLFMNLLSIIFEKFEQITHSKK